MVYYREQDKAPDLDRTFAALADPTRRALLARLSEADAYVTATDGDNTNIVSAQIAHEHFGVRCCVARVFDPLRADLFEQTGIRTVCPTKDAHDLLHDAVRSCRL